MKQKNTKRSSLVSKLLLLVILLVVAALLTACSTTNFMIKAVYEESKILLGRKSITKLVEDPSTPQEEREKLQVVSDARTFAQTMGLDPGESFTKYTRVDRDVLLWVVAGSKPDAFELHTWWFPFVGNVPYKGFFGKQDALKEGERLVGKGFETYIRGSDAFSTLGWFNDPVLSTTLQHPKTVIANTVIHESVHSTVWIQDHVPFNESLANFVGFQGAIDFFTSYKNYSEDPKLVEEAKLSMQREFEIAEVIENLYTQLDALYKSSAPKEDKLIRRSEIFQKETTSLRAKYPQMKILTEVNNAELMQLRFYMTKLEKFHALWQSCNKDWSCFLDQIRELREKANKGPEKDPYKILDQILLTNLEKSSDPG